MKKILYYLKPWPTDLLTKDGIVLDAALLMRLTK
jgi:hypothetical protein